MTETVSIESTFPGLSDEIVAISYSGCCAIFLDGTLIGNGALLWSGKHILTAARVVNGLTPSSNLTFQFDTSASYTVPAISAITKHPNFAAAGTIYDHNIAIIEFSTAFSTVLERYRIEKVPNAVMQRVVRRTYGKTVDPVTGNVDGITPSYWIATTDQLGNIPRSVAVDSTGNIYQLALYSESSSDETVLIKYSPYAEIIWQISLSDALHVDTYRAVDMSITSDDGIVIAGSILFSGASTIVKILSSGGLSWATTLTGFSGFDASTIDADSTGKILVCGFCYVSSVTCTGQILMTASGSVTWAKYEQTDNFYEAFGVLDGGYTYAVTTPQGSPSAFFLLKYNTDSGYWSSRKFTAGAAYLHRFQCICKHASNFYAGGMLTETATNIERLYLGKFDTSISTIWQIITNNSSNYNFRCDDIAADSNGVIATVTLWDTTTNNWNEIIAAFDTSGNLLWQRLLSAPDTGIDTVRITIVDSVSFIISGETYTANDWDTRIFTARLARDGSGTGTYGNYSYQSTSIFTFVSASTSSLTPPNTRGTISGTESSGGAAAFPISYTRYKDTIVAGSNAAVRLWKAVLDVYEANGLFHTYTAFSPAPITVPAHVVSDYDDGTFTRNIINKKIYVYGTGPSTFTQTNNVGFVTTDNYGAPAFIGANLAGVVGSILAVNAPTDSISTVLGTYGTVAYDAYVAYYASYLETVVGSSSPYPDILATPLLSPSLQLANGPLTDPRPKYDPAIGTYIIQSGTSSSSLELSNDYGKTWISYNMPFTYSPAASRYAYFTAIAKYGNRIVIAGSRQIYTCDDNYETWVERFDALANNQGPVNLTRHPYSGVWVAGAFGGRIHSSTDNAETWTTTQLVPNYILDMHFHTPSATFIAYNSYGVFTSTTGETWVQRSSGINYMYSVGTVYFTDAFTASIDGGATWVDIKAALPCYLYNTSRVDFYYLQNKYFAFRHTSGDGPHTAISDDGFAWRPITDLERFNMLIGSQKIQTAAEGNGLLVLGLGSAGIYLVSDDVGATWTSYDFLAGDFNRLVYDIKYSEALDLWIACGPYGFFAYSKDPRCSWRVETINDSYGDPATINRVGITPQSVIPYGSYDTWYIDAPSGPIIQPEPVYASKVTPIANSGLLGIVSGSTHFSGTLLQTGRHILTSAHAVVGITSGDYAAMYIVFNVDAAITIAPPTVIGITSHPSYSATPNTAGWINYDLAIIELAQVVDPRVSRYELYTGDEAMPRVFDKTGYGHAWDPVSGVAELDNLHFIAFQNRYESLGAPLQTLGIPYIASSLHLLYDYDNGSGLQDAIGDSAAFVNQPSDLGLGANEGFTAPGRSGSAGLLAGKIAGVTFGTYSVAPYDINGGGNDATYGEIGIDIRISQFTGWIADAADFGVDFTNTLAGLSAELEFSPPTGFRVDGELSTLTGEITAVLTPSLAMDVLVPGLDSDIALVSPWQVEATLTPLYGTIEIAACELFTAESTLSGFSADFELTPRVLIALENSLPGFGSQIELALSNRFSLQGLLGITSQIGLAPVDTFALSSVLPGISVDLTAASGFYLASVLPGIKGDLQAESNSMSFAGYLAALRGSVAIDSGEFIVSLSLAGLKGAIAMGNQQYGIEGYLPTLQGGLTVTDAEIFKSEATLPGLMFDGLWRSFEISGELAGLRGSIRYDSAMCSTRYL